MMRLRSIVFYADLRHSVLRWVAPILGLVSFLLMKPDSSVWLGVWPQTSAALTATLVYIAPVIAGVCAWEAHRRRSIFRCDEGVQPRLSVLMVQLFLAALVLLVQAALASVMTWHAGAPPGFLWPSYVLLALVTLWEASAVGFLLGSMAGPTWFAPMIACLLTFLRLVVTQGSAVGSSESRWTRIFLAGPPWMGISAGGLLVAALECLVMITLSIALPVCWERWRERQLRFRWSVRVRTECALLVLACMIGCGFVATGPALTFERPAPSSPSCTNTTMRICVWPEDSLKLPALTTLADRSVQVAELLSVPLPAQIGEVHLDPKSGGFVMESANLWFVSSYIADSLVGERLDLECTPAPGAAEEAEYWTLVRQISHFADLYVQGRGWSRSVGDSTGVDYSDAERALSLSTDQQREWIESKFAQVAAIEAMQCG